VFIDQITWRHRTIRSAHLHIIKTILMKDVESKILYVALTHSKFSMALTPNFI